MNKEETLVILKAISNAYPNFHAEDIQSVLNTWASVLKDYSASDIQNALMTYIKVSKSGFAPSISQLIGMLDDSTTAEESWSNEIIFAIRDSLYHAEQRFERLSATAQAVVGSPEVLREWAGLPSDVVHSSVAKQYKENYRTVSERMKRNSAVSGAIGQKNEQLNKLIGGIGNGGDI